MNEKNIESILVEQRLFPPTEEFASRAKLKEQELAALYAEAEADHEAFWAARARAELHWQQPFTTVLDQSRAPNYAWFTDGELNVSENCLDVHIAERGDKPAIIFENIQRLVRLTKA